MDAECSENSADRNESSEESEDEEFSYIRTRRGVIQVNKVKPEKKPDRLNGEYSYQNTIKQRVIGQPCLDCRMGCDLRVAERFRQDNYLAFWGKLKTWEDRRTHIRRLVNVLYVPHPKNETRKKFLRKYYLEIEDGYTLVCKTMFFNTLAISAKFVETTIQKYPENVLDETKVKLINSPSVIPRSLDSNNSVSQNAKRQISSNEQIKDEPLVLENEILKQEEIPAEGQLLVIDHKEDIKPPCNCPEQCGQKITEETRLKIYEHFWLKLNSWEERKLFIINTIEKDRYTSIRTFVLPMKDGGHITVCQEMYLNTLALSEKAIDLLLPKTEPIKPPKRKMFPDYSEFAPPSSHNQQSTPIIEKLPTPKDNLMNITKDLLQLTPIIKRSKLEFAPLRPPCACYLDCKAKLTEDIRQQIHSAFWNLPAQVDQKHFILSTIQTDITRNKATKEKIYDVKYFMLPWHYDNIMVCKEMYLNTLTVSEDFVLSTIRNVNHDGSIREDDDQNCSRPTSKPRSQAGASNRGDPGSEDYINCADLLESQIKEDVLHSAKSEVVRRVKKPRSSKTMGPPCPSSCRHQCSGKFTDEERRELHDKFWYNMDWQGRKQFVMTTVEEFPIKNRSIPGRLTKRNFSRIYTLPLKGNKITVCQKMYFNTLSICSKFVSTVHIWASQVKW